MAEVKANHLLVSIVTLARFLRADAPMLALMKSPRWKKVDGFASQVEAITTDIGEIENMGSGTEDAVFEKTHRLLKRLLKGVRYVYSEQPGILAGMEPLQVGSSETEDFQRTTFVLAKVTGNIRPKFAWCEDFTADMLREQLKAHHTAHAAVTANSAAREKEAQLRALRPAAERLWTDEKLEQWIEANADTHEDAVAMGLERRKRARKPKAEGSEAAPPKRTTKNGKTAKTEPQETEEPVE